MNTAKTLGLNRTYYRRDGMEKRMLFLDSPIALEAPQTILDTLRVGMTVTVDIKGDRADIDVTRGRFKTTVAAASDATLPATVKTPGASYHYPHVKLHRRGADHPDRSGQL